MPHASTPANRPSADTPTHTAPGNSTANGAARRATCSSPIARAATRTAAAADAPTAITSSPAAPPPPSPIRSSTTKTRNAPGGWAPTCVVQNHVWSGSTAEVRMCPANSRSSTGSAGAPGTSCRYSSADVRRSTTPRCHPSTSASASVHTAAATPVSAGSARHGRRSAHAGPRATTTTATTTADRRARPDVGQPLRQQRRERQVQGRPVREEAPTDRRGRDHERPRGRDDDEISPPRSPEPADPVHRRTVRPGSGDHARNRRSPTRAPKTTADAPNSTARQHQPPSQVGRLVQARGRQVRDLALPHDAGPEHQQREPGAQGGHAQVVDLRPGRSTPRAPGRRAA